MHIGLMDIVRLKNFQKDTHVAIEIVRFFAVTEKKRNFAKSGNMSSESSSWTEHIIYVV